MENLLAFFRNKTNKEELRSIPNERYKKEQDLTADDYALIDTDRKVTGINSYSDEYYYNNILFYNYITLKQTI